jgi:hypothetical protein
MAVSQVCAVTTDSEMTGRKIEIVRHAQWEDRDRIQQIVPARPLARIRLAATPPITALLMHRDIKCPALRTGQGVDVATS